MKTLTAKKDIRKFGLTALLFFGTLCGLAVWRNKQFPMFFFGTLGTLGFLFLLLPGPMKPVYMGWLKVAHFIQRTVTTVLLSSAYYLVITPFAFLKRIFGGRPLPIKPDKNIDSYWKKREEPAQPIDHFIKRY